MELQCCRLCPFDAVTSRLPVDNLRTLRSSLHHRCIPQVLAVEEAAGERPATATVRLQRSDTTVTVRCSDLVETNEARAARDAARHSREDRGGDSNGAYLVQVGLNLRLRLSQCVCVARGPRRGCLCLSGAVLPEPTSVWAGVRPDAALQSLSALLNLTVRPQGFIDFRHQLRHESSRSAATSRPLHAGMIGPAEVHPRA